MDDDDRQLLGATAGRVVDVVTAAAAELDAGLTPPQLRVVVVLHEQGPSSVSAVAAATRSSVSSASRTADRLAALGLLERDTAPDDRREVLLRLTRRGRATAREWVDRRSEALVAALEAWPQERLEALLAVLREEAAPAPAPAAAAVREPRPAQVRAALVEAADQAPPERAASALVTAAARVLGATAVQLSLLSRSGAQLLPLPARSGDGQPPAAPVDALLLPGPVLLEAAGAAGDALRRGAEVAERAAGHRVLHAPVVGRREVLGVLTVLVPDADDTPGAAGAPDPTGAAGGAGEGGGDSGGGSGGDARGGGGRGGVGLRDAVHAAAAGLALLLPAAAGGDRRLEQERRAHEWTVAAEVQASQLPGSRLEAGGVVAAAQLQPAWEACTDAYDLAVLTAPGLEGAVDAVLLDCRTSRQTAPLATAVALGALRHARDLGRDLDEAVALADQAVFGAFGGEAVVDLVVVRVLPGARRVLALATERFTVHRVRDGALTELPLGVHEATGASGAARYAPQELDVSSGDRLVLLGDGLNRHGTGAWRAERLLQRLASAPAHEVVRCLVVDRLLGDGGPTDDSADGERGLDDDATAVCLDL